MRAVVVDHAVPGHLRIAEVPDPVPAPHEALVRVAAFSLNAGEVRLAHEEHPDGLVLGWEAAGTVAAAATDGSGPAVGTPVVTLGPVGGWAEYRAVPAAPDATMAGGLLAPVDAAVDLGAAATTLVAGGSALRALRRIGPLLGRRVLVTGATGGVGRFAVQLAHRAGAHVIALTRAPERLGAALRALGADEVLADPAELDAPVHGVVDNVGGATLPAAFAHLAPHGVLVGVGNSREVVFPPGALRGGDGPGDASMVTFYLLHHQDLGPDLTWLAGEVARGVLDPGVVWRGPWADVAEVAARLDAGALGGKAVADVTG